MVKTTILKNLKISKNLKLKTKYELSYRKNLDIQFWLSVCLNYHRRITQPKRAQALVKKWSASRERRENQSSVVLMVTIYLIFQYVDNYKTLNCENQLLLDYYGVAEFDGYSFWIFFNTDFSELLNWTAMFRG